MNVKDLTNTELLTNANLKNKILAKIPNTPFHLLFTLKTKQNKWDIHLIQIATTNRTSIGKNIATNKVNKIITQLIKDPAKLNLKKEKRIKQFAKNLLELFT